MYSYKNKYHVYMKSSRYNVQAFEVVVSIGGLQLQLCNSKRVPVRPDPKRDLYAILGVDKKATLDEIRKAYIEKTKQLHPDALGSLNEIERKQQNSAFIELKNAYDVLKKPADRKAYDCRREDRHVNSQQASRFRSNRFASHKMRYGRTSNYDNWFEFGQRQGMHGSEKIFPEEVGKYVRKQFGVIIRVVVVSLFTITLYYMSEDFHVYVSLSYVNHQRRRHLEYLSDKDEIARSFLRQPEFDKNRHDLLQVESLAQILKGDIDSAYRRKKETLITKDV
ncbi:unnamed protein product [Dracunculus medinensis]|uniref:J domain-containing protein n=1 Tax=Dracunculus medinensis TaxID=318479 RepID=A0A0N4U6K2_DRAME|nr:unnamed protein product [Dracunculus medinensis]